MARELLFPDLPILSFFGKVDTFTSISDSEHIKTPCFKRPKVNQPALCKKRTKNREVWIVYTSKKSIRDSSLARNLGLHIAIFIILYG